MPFEKGNTYGSLKGSHNKTKQWDELSKVMTEDWAMEIKEHGNRLLDKGEYEEFKRLFLDLVNYFKPRMQSTTLDANITGLDEITIKGKRPDEN